MTEAFYRSAYLRNIPNEVAERILTSELKQVDDVNRTTVQAIERASNRLKDLGQ